MNKSMKKVTALVLTLALVMGVVVFPTYSAGGVDKTTLISPAYVKEIKVTQNGVNVPDGGNIAYDDDIRVKLEFGVPVIGDDGLDLSVDGNNDATFVQHGDWMRIKIAEGFKIVSGTGPYALEHGSGLDKRVVGTLNFVTEGSGINAQIFAEIDFDGDTEVFDGSEGWHSIICDFNVTLKYNGVGQGTTDITYDVEIIDKAYKVPVPKQPEGYSGEKKGEISGTISGDTITWSVELRSLDSSFNPTPFAAGTTFYDNLSSVGAYVPDSFRVGLLPDGSGAVAPVAPNPVAEYSGNILTFDLEGQPGIVYVFFETKISNTDYYNPGGGVITNKAQIQKDSTIEVEMEDTVSFNFGWIKKEGAVHNYDHKTNKGEIWWTITANQQGLSLTNAIITDILPTGLEFLSAEWNTFDGTNWNLAGTFPTQPPGDNYNLGNINTPVQLIIKTKVDDVSYNIGHEVQYFTNDATIIWDEYDGTGAGAGTGGKTVGIGLNPINKKAGSYDVLTHTIPWTVTIKESDVNVDLYVLELLVYGSATLNLNTITGSLTWAEGTSIAPRLTMDWDTLKGLSPTPTQTLNQRYESSSFAAVSATDDLAHVIYTLYDGADAVADVLLVAKSDGDGIDVSTNSQSFSFTTKVTNPDIYAGNTSKAIPNTAVLFSANKYINRSTAYAQYDGKMLVKDMLKRNDALLNSSDEVTDKNGTAASVTQGYNYEDHSVVFRLHINANGLDLTNDITADPAKSVGDVVLEDILPKGWDFIPVEPGKNFLLYEGTGGTDGKVTAVTEILSPVFVSAAFTALNPPTEQSGKVEFTFTTLDKPYVILLRAEPSDGTIEDYFKENGTYNLKNTATLKGKNGLSELKHEQSVRVISDVLKKERDISIAGLVTWTVEYRPNNIGDKNIGAKITDVLPDGIDLRTDASGNLVVTESSGDNIEVWEMTLNIDGTYTPKAPKEDVAALIAAGKIAYDRIQREFVFEIPDPAKAYRLVYITDVTGEPGNIRNKAKLESVWATETNVYKNFDVQDKDVSATMDRSGHLEITKMNGSTSPATLLNSIEFTLFAEDGVTVLRQGVTVGGKLAFRALPDNTPGNYYTLKETTTASGFKPLVRTYDVTVKTVGGKPETDIASSGSNLITLYNYKSDAIGALEFSKTASGSNKEAGKVYAFTVNVPAAIGPFDYNLTEGAITTPGIIEFTAGTATIGLEEGQSIEIIGLPTGSYTVTETDYSAEGYVTSITGDVNAVSNIAAGNITAGNTTLLAFKNSRMGWIKIVKVDAGNASIKLKDAEFTLFNLDGTVAAGPAKTDASGELWFYDIEVGSYKLRETAAPPNYTKQYNDKNIGAIEHDVEVSYDGTTITTDINSSGTNTITLDNFKNSTVGDLIIKKTLSGNNTDSTKDFEFTLEMLSLANETFDYIGIGTPSGSFTFDAAGVYTFTLKGDQSIQIIYLPEGKSYTVVETDYSGDKYTTTPADYSGTIVPDSIEIASFNNHKSKKVVPKTGTLMISKKVTGNAGDKSKKFTFTVTFSDKVQSFEYVGDLGNGTIKSGDKIQLAHGESITIVEIPDGVTYKIVEDDYTDDGYKHGAINSSGTIKEDIMAVATFTNDKHDEDIEEEGVLGDTDEKDPDKPGKPGDEDGGVLGDDARLPKTGDDFMPAVWVAGLIASLLGIWYVLRRRSSFGEE